MRGRGTGLRGGAAGPPRRLLLRHCQLMLSVSTHCVSFMHSNIECKNLSSQICLCLCNFKRISHNQTRYIQISKDCLSSTADARSGQVNVQDSKGQPSTWGPGMTLIIDQCTKKHIMEVAKSYLQLDPTFVTDYFICMF